MGSLWALLAAWLSLCATAQAPEAVRARQGLLDAKAVVVDAALALREVRLAYERSEAALDEAEAAVHAAQLKQEQENGKPANSKATSVASAEAKWRRAFKALEASASRLGRAETRLQAAEGALKEAETLPGTSLP